ncbi:MAG TPA: NAD(P)-dependent oxidoreductase [Ohtaekwangia sp.]|uniref:NAD(P)-dependent oxidoreductase n=1 Tax=Ohtaekwangia sp. TaxID=2066019 RepID=UPI002F947E55
MDFEKEKSLLIEELKLIDDPLLLRAIQNLIAEARRKYSDDLFQADMEMDDPDLNEALAEIKRSRIINSSTDDNE